MVPLDANFYRSVHTVIRTQPSVCGEKRGKSGLRSSTGAGRGWFREAARRAELSGFGGFYRVFAAFIAVDGAKFVAGGAVLFLFGDGGDVGEVVGGGHGDEAGPEAGEGRVAVEVGVVLGVNVEEVKRFWIVGDRGLNMAEEAAQDGEFEGVEEEGEGGFGGEGMGGGVGVMEDQGGEGVGL